VDRRKWKNMLKSTDIVWCYRHKKLGCLRGDTALTNRGLRQKDSQGNSGGGLHHKPQAGGPSSKYSWGGGGGVVVVVCVCVCVCVGGGSWPKSKDKDEWLTVEVLVTDVPQLRARKAEQRERYAKCHRIQYTDNSREWALLAWPDRPTRRSGATGVSIFFSLNIGFI
jgi:hypothetical protein